MHSKLYKTPNKQQRSTTDLPCGIRFRILEDTRLAVALLGQRLGLHQVLLGVRCLSRLCNLINVVSTCGHWQRQVVWSIVCWGRRPTWTILRRVAKHRCPIDVSITRAVDSRLAATCTVGARRCFTDVVIEVTTWLHISLSSWWPSAIRTLSKACIRTGTTIKVWPSRVHIVRLPWQRILVTFWWFNNLGIKILWPTRDQCTGRYCCRWWWWQRCISILLYITLRVIRVVRSIIRPLPHYHSLRISLDQISRLHPIISLIGRKTRVRPISVKFVVIRRPLQISRPVRLLWSNVAVRRKFLVCKTPQVGADT